MSTAVFNLQSAIKRSNSALSKACSKIAKLEKARSSQYEEIYAYGAPSECYSDVTESYEHLLLALFDDELGITPDELHAAISARTNEKIASSICSEASHVWRRREERRTYERSVVLNRFRLGITPRAKREDVYYW